MEDAARMADRIVVMNRSRILMQGTPAEVFSRADELVRAGLSIPQVTQVLLKLRSLGLDISTDAITVEQAVNLLRAYKEGRSC